MEKCPPCSRAHGRRGHGEACCPFARSQQQASWRKRKRGFQPQRGAYTSCSGTGFDPWWPGPTRRQIDSSVQTWVALGSVTRGGPAHAPRRSSGAAVRNTLLPQSTECRDLLPLAQLPRTTRPQSQTLHSNHAGPPYTQVDQRLMGKARNHRQGGPGDIQTARFRLLPGPASI